VCGTSYLTEKSVLTQRHQGILMFLAGFFVWNMDNIFCRHITETKQQIQLPWSAILEGHGWWHILTGAGGEFL